MGSVPLYHYVSENEYGLQTLDVYIRLKSGYIIAIPDSDNDDYLFLSPENLHYFKSRFDKGMLAHKELTRHIIGQKIIDFHFRYYNDELDFNSDHYVQLANGMYLTANSVGPIGLAIDVFVLDQKQFADRTNRQDIRSFVAMRKAALLIAGKL